MRFLVLLIAFLSPSFAVQANDLFINQRDSTNTFTVTRFGTFPAAGANGIMVMNGTTVLPQVALFAGGIEFDGTNLTTNGVPQANISGLTAALGAKASTSALATVAFTGNYADLSGAPAGYAAPAKQTPFTPSLSTTYQPSSTRWAFVNTSGRLDTSISLVGSSEAYLIYETCPNSSFAGGTTAEEGRIYNGNGGSLVVGLTLQQKIGSQVAFSVPPGYYWRVTQVNVTTTGGTPTATLYPAQWVLEF